jgi:cobalt-zinc-cadmium efflux system outer membrane protein
MWEPLRAAVRPLWTVVLALTTSIGALAASGDLAPSDGASSPRAAGRPGAEPAPPTARRTPALTEQEALRLGLADPAFAQLQDAQVDLARSEVLEASLAPNPELGLSYESDSGIGEPAETTLRLSQTFDTSGRRSLREQSAVARLESARLQAEGARQDRRAQLLRRFYAALHEQERAAVLRSWEARVAEAANVVRDRAGAGDASGYDLRRLEHERALARAERDEAGGRLAQARAELFSLLDSRDRGYGDLAGRLLPAVPAPVDTLAAGIEQRPDIRALRQREEAARLGQQAGRRGVIPDVTVGLGAKRVSEVDRNDWGVVLDLSIPLTLFDRGQATVARADAETRAVAGEYVLAVREARGSLQGLWQKAIELQRAASRLQASEVAQARNLAQTARSAYQAGEIGIVELLDAHRTVKETEMRALDLSLEARVATIELARVSGETER